MNQHEIANQLAEFVRGRKTEKVMCDVESHQYVPEEVAVRNRQIVLDAIETAGWAPFHYPRNVDGIAEPWRVHVLWHEAAGSAARHLKDKLQVTSKEPRLAAGCNALAIVTWLPEFYDEDRQTNSKLSREEQVKRDEEHLAATSAMVQNLLLLLTANGMGTYWSSGGKFRGSEMFDFLSIPKNERFLAGVFIEYPEMMDDSKERKAGAHRNKRSGNWIREVPV
jgi:nitroreductase